LFFAKNDGILSRQIEIRSSSSLKNGEQSVKKSALMLGLFAAALLFAGASQAQLAPPNDAGVTMGHLHFVVSDLDANVKFWTTLGGTPFKFGPGQGVKFPGVLILLRKGDPTGPMDGSIVNHVGFHVPNVQAALAKWKADGIKTEAGRSPQQGYVYTPDGLAKIEFLEDSSMSVPIAFHHVHFYVAANSAGADSIPEIKAWYVKMFGAKPGKAGQFEIADIPGVSFRFTKSDTPVVGTKGRSLDHIGIEIKNLEAFCKMVEANGVKFDMPYTKRPDLGISLAFLTDPWGTYIELNEGLDHY
jgi:catechol 2,3-dioxygenase-like lactoylglutathione lyase family enzyme